jgi:transcription antitermination factor NusB
MLSAADINPPLDVEGLISSFFNQLNSLDKEDGGLGFEIDETLLEFAAERVRGVLLAKDEIDAKISSLLEEWDISRLGTVERAVLRLGVWELTNTQVPKAVVINEAVDLVKYFSSMKSRSIVNGVLDRLAKGCE